MSRLIFRFYHFANFTTPSQLLVLPFYLPCQFFGPTVFTDVAILPIVRTYWFYHFTRRADFAALPVLPILPFYRTYWFYHFTRITNFLALPVLPILPFSQFYHACLFYHYPNFTILPRYGKAHPSLYT